LLASLATNLQHFTSVWLYGYSQFSRSPVTTYIVNKRTLNKLTYSMRGGRPQARSYQQQHKTTVLNAE